MSKRSYHSYGGEPKPPPPQIRSIFSPSASTPTHKPDASGSQNRKVDWLGECLGVPDSLKNPSRKPGSW